jgi:hypothetical protein
MEGTKLPNLHLVTSEDESAEALERRAKAAALDRARKAQLALSDAAQNCLDAAKLAGLERHQAEELRRAGSAAQSFAISLGEKL